MSEWLYYRVYPGDWSLLDALVEHAVPGARALMANRRGIGDWFFLRFVDPAGPHVRLRVEVDDQIADETHRQLWAFLWTTLGSITDQRRERSAPFAGDAGVRIDVYEPEQHKYGTGAQLARCHRVFRSSSELVLDLLAAGTGRPSQRRSVAVVSMREAARRVGLDHREFWRQYADHWSGGRHGMVGASVGATSPSRPDLDDADRQLAAIPTMDRYLAALDDAVDRLADTAPGSHPLGEARARLLFHLLHLTNNRLGLSTIEEAFAASLLEARAPDGRTPRLGIEMDEELLS